LGEEVGGSGRGPGSVGADGEEVEEEDVVVCVVGIVVRLSEG
jgi:hypothetical protein